METGTQVSGWSSSDDEGPSVTRQISLRMLQKHSIRGEPTLSAGLDGSLLPAHSSKRLLSSQARSGTTAALQKQQLSTMRASEVSTEQLGSSSDIWAFREDPFIPTSGTRWQQQKKSSQRKHLPKTVGIPTIQNSAGLRRRGLKKQLKEEAVKERVRQWEIRLLRDIEEATQHELTIQAE